MPINWDGNYDDDSGPYADLPWAGYNVETGVFSVDLRTGRGTGRRELLKGTALILDYGSLYIGYVLRQQGKRQLACMRPAHEGMPERPAGTDWRDAVQMQAWIAGVNMVHLTLAGAFNVNAMNRVAAQFRRAPQAVAGQLLIYSLGEPELIEWNEGKYRPIVLISKDEWVDRDPDIFGERIVPPPKGRAGATVIGFTPPTVLPGAAAASLPAAALPPAVAETAVAAVAAATATATPVATETPELPFSGPYTAAETAAAAGSPVADPFAIFRRGSKPTPQPIPQPNS
jgi:hypothetical protein